MKTVLLLGAGRISAPYVDYLLRKGSCKIVVADVSEENLKAISALSPAVETVKADVAREAGALIDKYRPEVAALFLPPELLTGASRTCLEKRVNVVHPVYLTEETRAMADEIREAGLIFVAELGLDPGIDHMSASQNINEIHAAGGKVHSFRSLCGALPALESNTNPWGYKLSWSPSSLIGASKRTAKILQDGKEILWPDGETYEHAFLYEVPRLGVFEAYANADSTVYRESHNIPEAESIYRGTLRFQSWCETICYMNQIGFFETEPQNTEGMTFAGFTARQCGYEGMEAKEALCRRFDLKGWSAFVLRMGWLGFFDDRPLPFASASARDVVSYLFAEKLNFTPDERDLVVLCDEIVASFPDGSTKQYNSVLIDYGIPGKWTSCSRTTGVPPAIATRFILEGRIKTPGLHVPMSPEIYEPVLAELKNEDIVLEETVVSL